MHNLTKYVCLYKLYSKYSLLLLFAHRFNLIMGSVANLVWTGFQLLTLQFLFQRIPDFEGWTFAELVLLLAFGQCFVYISFILYDNNLDQFSQKLRDGSFEISLLKPVNIVFQSSFERIAVAQVIAMFTTVTPLFVFGLYTLEEYNLLFFLQSVLILLLGIVLLYFFRLTLAGLSFFFEQADSIKMAVLDGTRDLTRIPLSIYPSAIRLLFMYFVPLAFVTFFPLQILANKRPFGITLLIEILLLIVFFILYRIIWSKGLQRYSGVSS